MASMSFSAFVKIFLTTLMVLAFSSVLVEAQTDLASLPAGCRRFADPSDTSLEESRLLIHLDIADQGQIVHAEPGEILVATCTFQIYSGADNPSEISQGFFIMSWTSSWPPPSGNYIPIYQGIAGVYPGVTETETFGLVAPTSGTYYLYWCGEAHYSMRQAVDSYDQPLGLPAHAKIVVSEPTDQSHQDLFIVAMIVSAGIAIAGVVIGKGLAKKREPS